MGSSQWLPKVASLFLTVACVLYVVRQHSAVTATGSAYAASNIPAAQLDATASPCRTSTPKRRYGVSARSATPKLRTSKKTTILVLTTDTNFVRKAVATISQVRGTGDYHGPIVVVVAPNVTPRQQTELRDHNITVARVADLMPTDVPRQCSAERANAGSIDLACQISRGGVTITTPLSGYTMLSTTAQPCLCPDTTIVYVLTCTWC